MRCRICDELVDHPKKDLSPDGCCRKCVDASDDLFDEDTDVLPWSDTPEFLELLETIGGEIFLVEGNASDYE